MNGGSRGEEGAEWLRALERVARITQLVYTGWRRGASPGAAVDGWLAACDSWVVSKLRPAADAWPAGMARLEAW